MATLKNILSPASLGLGASKNRQAFTRCGGLLIKADLFDDTGHMCRWAWRCVQCGDIVDSLILKHHMGINLPALNAMSRRCWTMLKNGNNFKKGDTT